MNFDELIELLKNSQFEDNPKIYIVINKTPGGNEYWRDRYIVSGNLMFINKTYSRIYSEDYIDGEQIRHRQVLNSWVHKTLDSAKEYFLSLIIENNFGAKYE